MALALKELFNADNEIVIIGPRHGEKMYETLCSREQMSKAIDLDGFYRIPADLRNLNYSQYRKEGGAQLVEKEYNSDNTERLDVEAVKKKLLDLKYVRIQLGLDD